MNDGYLYWRVMLTWTNSFCSVLTSVGVINIIAFGVFCCNQTISTVVFIAQVAGRPCNISNELRCHVSGLVHSWCCSYRQQVGVVSIE